jgi:DNA gyrase subunit A
MVAMLSLDPRALDIPPQAGDASEPEPPYGLAITRSGFGFRFSLRGHREPSTRSGRRFAKPKEGDEILAVMVVGETDSVICATADGYVLGVAVSEIPVLAGAGKGAIVMDVTDGERLVGTALVLSQVDRVTLETEKGKTRDVRLPEVLGHRANRGVPIVKRDRLTRIVPLPAVMPTLDVS